MKKTPVQLVDLRRFSGTSIEARLSSVERKLALLRLLVSAGEEVHFDDDEAEAIRDHIDAAIDDLSLVTKLPRIVLDLPAPKDSEIPASLIPEEHSDEYASPAEAAITAIVRYKLFGSIDGLAGGAR